MNELALFAGAGGGILGGKLLGWRTVCAAYLNPDYAEFLMGWPMGWPIKWAELVPLETDKFPQWLRSHAGY